MSLSAEDIVGYRFKQSLRGYAIDEVDELLDQLADQVERTAAELTELRERVRVAEEQAAAASQTEATLRRTLVSAQETAERVVAEAEQEAATLRADASAEAERVRSEARRDADEVVQAAQADAQREVAAARARVGEALERHREVLDGVAAHRDSLRGHLRRLDELVAAGLPEPAREGDATDLVAGELPETAASGPDQPGESAVSTGEVPGAAGADDQEAGRPTDGLKVRVHDEASDGQPR